ncbi:MAG: hypothetical protein Q8936_06610 [Bacillota bacterium]|nr:hypothetical protein [Bacillota bacterium]
MFEIGPNARDAVAMVSISIMVVGVCVSTMLNHLKENKGKGEIDGEMERSGTKDI